MKIIAFYNIKGGVGKTASAINISYLSATAGYKTLLWDLDPQGASSYYLRVQANSNKDSKAFITGKRALATAIKGTNFTNFDLLPADFSARNIDLALDEYKKPNKRLRKLLQPVSADYAHIFLDCPPGISLLSEAILTAADIIICPIIPTPLSLRTLEQLLTFIENQDLQQTVVLPFFSMADRRKKMHLTTIQNLSKLQPTPLSTIIPYASDIERMGDERQPLFVFAGNSPSAHAYRQLWQEIEQQLVL